MPALPRIAPLSGQYCGRVRTGSRAISRIDRLRRSLRVLWAGWSQPRPIFLNRMPEGPVGGFDGLKVHLGSGNVNLQGWINVDARPLSHVHLRSSDLLIPGIADGAASVVYASHFLEHLNSRELSVVLNEAWRILKSNGAILISVPDFELLARLFVEKEVSLSEIQGAVLGGGTNPFDHHFQLFDKPRLAEILKKTGFTRVQAWDPVEVFGLEVNDFSNFRLTSVEGKPLISINMMGFKV